jgi:hypothetical protein
MGLRIASFLSLVLVALALAPAMAHLLELPNKITLSREDYLTVQQIYRGWALRSHAAGTGLNLVTLTALCVWVLSLRLPRQNVGAGGSREPPR